MAVYRLSAAFARVSAMTSGPLDVQPQDWLLLTTAAWAGVASLSTSSSVSLRLHLFASVAAVDT